MICENLTEFDYNEFECPDCEDGGRSAEELYDEYLRKLQKPDDEFIYFYGACYNVMTELTGCAMNLLMWMTFHCEVNSGRVLIQSNTVRDAVKELGVTTGTFYRSLAILREKGIVKGHRAKYFVNPAYAWKGTAVMRNRFMRIYGKF